jgi:hypothetical protein
LNVNGVKDVSQADVNTAVSIVPKSRDFEIELAIEKLKSHKSPGTDQIAAEFIEAGRRTI